MRWWGFTILDKRPKLLSVFGAKLAGKKLLLHLAGWLANALPSSLVGIGSSRRLPKLRFEGISIILRDILMLVFF
jgi:hypothetical protein